MALRTEPNLFSRHANLTPGLLVLACLIAYGLTAGGHFGSSDEHDLYANTALLASRYAGLFGATAAPEPNLDHLAPQELGQSLVALPWYWLSQAVAGWVPPYLRAYVVQAVMTTFNIVVTLLTVVALYRWLREMASRRVAWVVAGLYGLATMAWPYSETFYREPLAGLCLLVAFHQADRFRTVRRRAYLVTSAAFMLAAIGAKTVCVLAVPWWIALWFPLEAGQPKRLVVYALSGAGLASAALLVAGGLGLLAKQQTLLDYVRELQVDAQAGLSVFLSYGLHGLLTSPGKGLLFCAPPILLAVAGFPAFRKRYPRPALAVAGVFVTFVLAYATRRGWHGGACWGPRYLLPVLPLALLFSVEVVRRCGRDAPAVWRRLARISVSIIAIAGMAVQLAAVSIFPINYYDVKAREGVISAASWDGGPGYLRELYFEPANSPILGQTVLAGQRGMALLVHGRPVAETDFPSDLQDFMPYVIGLEELDYWWVYCFFRSSDPPAPGTHRLE